MDIWADLDSTLESLGAITNQLVDMGQKRLSSTSTSSAAEGSTDPSASGYSHYTPTENDTVSPPWALRPDEGVGGPYSPPWAGSAPGVIPGEDEEDEDGVFVGCNDGAQSFSSESSLGYHSNGGGPGGLGGGTVPGNTESDRMQCRPGPSSGPLSPPVVSSKARHSSGGIVPGQLALGGHPASGGAPSSYGSSTRYRTASAGALTNGWGDGASSGGRQKYGRDSNRTGSVGKVTGGYGLATGTTPSGHTEERKHSGSAMRAFLDQTASQRAPAARYTSVADQPDSTTTKPPMFRVPSGVPSRKGSAISKSGKSGGNAGAVDITQFSSQFENTPKVQVFHGRDVEAQLNTVQETLSNPNVDWEKRVHALKIVRSVITAGGCDYEEFLPSLRLLESVFQKMATDLRSQIVRECCITIAYLAQTLGLKLERFSDALLSPLISMIPNSARVMATSATLACRFIITHVHSHKLLPIIASQMGGKSNVIRREMCSFLEDIFLTWPTQPLERHIATLQEGIRKAISDSDADTRAGARKAFGAFSRHFPDQAEHLFSSLEPSRQRQLQGELSNSSSSSSLVTTASSSTAGGGHQNRMAASAGGRLTARAPSQERDAMDAGNSLRGPSRKPPSRRPTPSAHSDARSETPVQHHARTRLPSASSMRDGSTGPGSGVKKISQSQPGSRSNSPSSRLFTSALGVPGSGRRRKSGIPRSQGASREASPTRSSGYGRERRLSGNTAGGGGQRIPHMRTSSGHQSPHHHRLLGLDSEDLMAQKLRGTLRGVGVPLSDDEMSETSSICSESLGGAGYRGRTSEDVSEILGNLASAQWAERKEGLRQLNHFIVNIRCLNGMELRRVTEVFTRMFFEPHAKVFSVFMDVLVELVLIHKHDLHEWLPTLLMRLLTRCGGELLTSVAAKVQHSLDTIRETFSNTDQFNVLTRFIIDQTQTPNLKVKLQILNYLHALILQMEAAEFVNTGDARLATSRIVTWVSEPKSLDIRRASQAVLIGLFNLNTPEFSAMLQGLPKSFQEEATKVIHNHMQGMTDSVDVSTPKNLLSGARSAGARSTTPSLKHPRSRQASVNQEDIYHSIRQTTADIQSLSLKTNRGEDVGASSMTGGRIGGGEKSGIDGKDAQRDSRSQDSGIQISLSDVRPPTEGEGRRAYNPSAYTDHGSNGHRGPGGGGPAGYADGDRDEEMLDPNDELSSILAELSNHDQRQQERERAMLNLIRMTRDGTMGQWDEHFKTLLLLLLETLGDDDAKIRAMALRVLQVIIEHQKNRFEGYAELTILKILEASKDTDKDVLRAADVCANSLALCIAPEHCLRVLCQITQQADYPVNLAAIKMETQVIEHLSKDSTIKCLGDILPGLLKGYDDSSSSVRKASVFALVALYNQIGESLRDYLGDLNGSKMKLLNLYINKAVSSQR